MMRSSYRLVLPAVRKSRERLLFPEDKLQAP